MTPGAFRALIGEGETARRDALTLCVFNAEDASDRLVVFFPDEDTVNVKTIKSCVVPVARQPARARAITPPVRVAASTKR